MLGQLLALAQDFQNFWLVTLSSIPPLDEQKSKWFFLSLILSKKYKASCSFSYLHPSMSAPSFTPPRIPPVLVCTLETQSQRVRSIKSSKLWLLAAWHVVWVKAKTTQHWQSSLFVELLLQNRRVCELWWNLNRKLSYCLLGLQWNPSLGFCFNFLLLSKHWSRGSEDSQLICLCFLSLLYLFPILVNLSDTVVTLYMMCNWPLPH